MPELKDWELESGLINDVDAWVIAAKFGAGAQYAKAVPDTEVVQALLTFANEEGEELGTQGYSVGTGWIISEDGQSISHPLRKNVVASSMYGQLQHRVVKELGVNMAKYGLPTDARSWLGLGFHLKQEEHRTVSGDMKTGAMPTEFLGERTVQAAAEARVVAKSPKLEVRLTELAQSSTLKEFRKIALKTPGVSDDDQLLAAILDESELGYWSQRQ